MKLDLIKLGKAIATCRIKLNLTQAELAEKAGISVQYLGGIETGKRSFSTITLNAILNALGVSYEECMTGDLSDDDLFCKSILTIYHCSDLTYNNKQFLMNMFSAINKRCN